MWVVWKWCEHRIPWGLEEWVPGARIIGRCELLCVDAGSQTWVFCKNSMSSEL